MVRSKEVCVEVDQEGFSAVWAVRLQVIEENGQILSKDRTVRAQFFSTMADDQEGDFEVMKVEGSLFWRRGEEHACLCIKE